jgi:DNA modification methylase
MEIAFPSYATSPDNSIDFILTDPPYLVRYQDREGRSIQNDSDGDWLMPAFTEAYRVLKQDGRRSTSSLQPGTTQGFASDI